MAADPPAQPGVASEQLSDARAVLGYYQRLARKRGLTSLQVLARAALDLQLLGLDKAIEPDHVEEALGLLMSKIAR